MQKLGLSGLKSLDNLKSLGGLIAGSAKNPPSSNPWASSDPASLGSFANLKLTAEKLVKEQASVKTDLELANAKLKKSVEHVNLLEAKLQEAVNENAKLKVKQNEESKLWKGLDSKLLSTKTFCGQLTETLQHLAGQVQIAEKDKKTLEGKLSENSKAINDLNSLLNDLSAKLEYAEFTFKSAQQEILELRQEKEDMEKRFRDECDAASGIIKEKDVDILRLKFSLEQDKMQLQTLDSQLQEVQHELISKEDICKCLKAEQEKLEKENNALQSSNEDFAHSINMSQQETKKLIGLVQLLTAKLVELDKDSRNVSSQIVKLFSFSTAFYELVQKEKDLTRKSAQAKFDHLHNQFSLVTTENDTFKLENNGLKEKVIELQKTQEIVMVQHAEECRLAEEKIRRLETEAEVLVSRKSELEKLVVEQEEKVHHLSETSSLTEKQKQDLQNKISKLETENQDIQGKLQLMLQERDQESEDLQREIARRDQHVDSLEKQIIQLHSVLDEKERLHLQFEEREKQLEGQISEIQASVAVSELKLADVIKQNDLMLEGKQLELSKHLKELSQRNDQAITEIRRKYELEKVEIAVAEKEKADTLIKDMERRCDEKISENREEHQQYLMSIKEEHATLISRIQQDHDQKESILRECQKEELQKVHLQAENEMRERMSTLRKEHEIQVKSLKLQYEDDHRKLEEELELQKSKEEKQRALLQLQLKVMSGNQQDDQEVNSKKEYSVSSIKMKDPHGGKDQLRLTGSRTGRKDVNLSGLIATPMASLLKRVGKGPGSGVGIPNHGQKVTHHEYEVETSNGRTIKRRKTRSTVMFGEPNTQKTPRTNITDSNKDVVKIRKVVGGSHPRPFNLGDLFSEGSLNPYTDDPYAFD